MEQLAKRLLSQFQPKLSNENVGLSFNIDEHLAYVNQEILDKLGYSSKEEVKLLHPFMLSPVEQPCGTLSSTKSMLMLKQAKVLGDKNFPWVHTSATGEEIKCHIYLYCVKEHSDVPDLDIYAIWQFL